MYRLIIFAFAAILLSMNTTTALADEGVPYSEHGDVTGESKFDPSEIEPAAGDIIEDNSEGVPYSEHGDITE